VACPACGTANQLGAKFCKKCGQAVSAASSAPLVRPSPETYTPKHLAEKILTSKSALEGERKQVTVLFADLKGSMELLADRDPEEARKILDPVLGHMMEAVHHYEGTVNQVMGDGIMALFGAPLAHEDHAVRACYAALRMQERVTKYAEEACRSHGAVVKIRVGLNSGEVVVRSIGSDLHMDYSAIGQTTHLAARMEQIADAGAILLAAATFGLAEDFIQVRPLGPTPVKGLSAPIDVYALTGATVARSRFQAHAARGFTKFVGRTGEMAQLIDALELARRGRGQVVAVVGEPGVGKSRLFWEFAHSHCTDGCLVLDAASATYGKATAYFPVIELLRGYFQIERHDDTRKIREKVTGRLSAERALESVLPALLALFDVPIEDDEAWTRLDPAQRRQGTLDAVRRLLLRESQLQPLVVIVEDLHWIDGETQAVLDGLVESLPTARLVLLVNYRQEYRHRWGSKTYYRQLLIDALRTASAAELLEAILGSDSSLEPLKGLLVARAEGNPFFLEESIRTLVETKTLVGDVGAYRQIRSLDTLQIPGTVQAIIAARIDRLAPEDKRLLQAASVIGKDVLLGLLEVIADMGDDKLHQCLARLQAAEFLYEAGLFPEIEYTFKHALTHEVTYGGLLQERRRVLHAQIVEAIERLYADRLSEHIERLALHARHGEVWEKAVKYLRQAGVRATERCAHREAVAYLEQALSALGHVPLTRDAQEAGIDIRLVLIAPLLGLGELERRLTSLREAQQLAEVLGDVRRVAHTLSCMTLALTHAGRTEEAVLIGQRCAELTDGLEDPILQIVARHDLGQAEWAFGAFRKAAERLRVNIQALQGQLSRERSPGMGPFPAVLSRFYLSRCLVELGELRDAEAIIEEAVGIADTLDDPWSRVLSYLAKAEIDIHRRDATRMLSASARALELCAAHVPFLFAIAASTHGWALARSNRVAEALALLERAVESATAMRIAHEGSLIRVRLGEGYLSGGRPRDARDTALAALEFARGHEQHGQAAWVHLLLGDIAQTDPSVLDDGADHYRRGLALAEPREMRLVTAHCHLGLSKLYRRTGNREQEHEHLATATTMYREMGMTYWLERAERQ
jgi:predicted ATPase/class 3 adenylate cyclase